MSDETVEPAATPDVEPAAEPTAKPAATPALTTVRIVPGALQPAARRELIEWARRHRVDIHGLWD